MKRAIARTFLLFAVVALTTIAVFPQKNARIIPAADKYLISAKAGKVNFTEGSTMVGRAVGTTGVLVRGDQLEVGDKITTSATGRAEILLNPGSYLRLGGDSGFEFKTTSLDDLRLKVNRGSAILEVFATNDFKVSAYTPKGRVTIVNTGVYRIDVDAAGNAILSVIEGRALVGERSVALVKEGRTATVNGGSPMIKKFDKDKRDTLAEWSRSRSKDLAKIASSLKNQNVRMSLIDSFQAGAWGRDRTMGVWVYDPFSRMFIFMPYYSGWNSPYGYGYGSYIYWYQLPPNVGPVNRPDRLDGRRDPPVDSEAGNGETKSRGAGRTEPTQRYDPSRDSKPERTYSPPPIARESSPPPPPPAPARVIKPIDN